MDQSVSVIVMAQVSYCSVVLDRHQLGESSPEVVRHLGVEEGVEAGVGVGQHVRRDLGASW